MKVRLINVDNFNFPNLALMAISAYHKCLGDEVDWLNQNDTPDLCYASKVFNYTSDFTNWPDCRIIKGGTGYDLHSKLPIEINEKLLDYDLYGIDYGIGFLTRGCIRRCEHCIVPEKEGNIRINADIGELIKSGARDVVLLDNNILAVKDYAIEQFKKITNLNLRVDFNQGLDARLIDDEIAYYMGKIKFIEYPRLACDSSEMKVPLEKAVRIMRKHNVTRKRYFCYALIKELEEGLDRVRFLKSLNLDVFAQPYRDLNNPDYEPPKILRGFARWVNHKAIFKSVTWEQYKERKRL